jgi:hypothetical protein
MSVTTTSARDRSVLRRLQLMFRGSSGTLGEQIPMEDRRYVIRTNDGDDYLQRIETAKWDAVKLHFRWTKDRDQAQTFTPKDISTVFSKVVAAYSAPQLERIA